MEISTFELLVKRIAPSPPAPANVARRVVQGYFLTITNLESRDLVFRIRFVISQPNPPDVDRTLFNNVEVRYDIAGANDLLTLSGGPLTTVFTTRFRLPANQTASLQLLPQAKFFTEDNPDFEVRGYVDLRLPRIQSETPVRVLLNPEIRGTFLPNDFPGGAAGDFDQINYSLAIASGRALNEIAPDARLTVPAVTVAPTVESLSQIQFEPEAAIEDREDSQNLVELMSQLDTDPKNLENLSDVLSKLNIPVRVSPV
jgi:hypothetical protein